MFKSTKMKGLLLGITLMVAGVLQHNPVLFSSGLNEVVKEVSVE